MGQPAPGQAPSTFRPVSLARGARLNSRANAVDTSIQEQRRDPTAARFGWTNSVTRSVLIAVILGAGVWPARAETPPSGSADLVATRERRLAQPAVGQPVARDGGFWVGSDPLELRGINVKTSPFLEDADVERIASWGMNFLRMQVNWSELEPNPPTEQSDHTWTHTYDAAYLDQVKAKIATAQGLGLYVLVDNHGCQTCGYFPFPQWLYQAPYNSHSRTYAETEDDAEQAHADFWSDELRQAFMRSALTHLATGLATSPGILGYEVLNEPQQGTLPSDHATTQMMVDVQLTLASAIREADPNRVIVFTTRAGFGPGVSEVDLEGFADLGNVAFDVHDYFGGRWGDGLGGEDPAKVDYHEGYQQLYNHVLAEQAPPYIGTAVAHASFFRQAKAALAPYDITLLVGEFGDLYYDPGVATFFGTVTVALGSEGVSWSTTAYFGPNGIVNNDGTLRPQAQIVIDAAQK
jgi:hypothetical protein